MNDDEPTNSKRKRGRPPTPTAAELLGVQLEGLMRFLPLFRLHPAQVSFLEDEEVKRG